MPPNWLEFDHSRKQNVEPATEQDASDICARVLTSGDGKEFLRHLYALYVDKRCRPQATEAELREAEAKRQLVHDLEKLRDDGLKRAVEQKKTA